MARTGRPPKYKTPEERAAAKREQARRGQDAYRRRNRDNPEFKARKAAVDAASYQKHHASRVVRGRAAHLKRKYGLTPEQYDAMAASQGDKCLICPRVLPRGDLHVDHDHDTGEVRGLLCGSCNRAIGLLQDSAAIAMRASEYLKHHGRL